MKYEAKEFTLKNGKQCLLRSANAHDAKEFLDFFIQISSETENTIRYPEEIKMTVEKEALILKAMEESKNQCMIGAYVDGKYVGNANFYCVGDRIKLRHRAAFGISVLKEMWGMGIGRLLLQELIALVTKEGYEQLELDVMSNNTRAIELYKKMGFVECGRVPHGIKLKNGNYVDLIMMVKSLGN